MGITPDGRIFELQEIYKGFPRYYTTFNVDAARTTRTDSVQYLIGGGSGITIGIWDGGSVRTTHQELAPRVVWADVAPYNVADHATHVAGTMIASGVEPAAKGMVPEALLRSFNWNNDLGEMAEEASEGLLLSNHSYGTIRGWYWYVFWYWYGDTAISETEDYRFGFYDEFARDCDEVAHAAPHYLIVVSAGNDRNDSAPPGTEHYYWDVRYGYWQLSTMPRDPDGGTEGYDCISDGMQAAKNVLTVGAVNDVPDYTEPSDVVMTSFSNWGPTDDGRIKPDIVGNGLELYSSIAYSDTSYNIGSGTSMSSPNVCGSLALLQQYYYDQHNGWNMKAATLKALAIHTAREAGPDPGPDYMFGWGLLDTYAAYERITMDLDERKGHIEELTLHEDSPLELPYECDGTEPELKVTICWIDPPGTPPEPALDPPDLMIVNDLDLRVIKGATEYQPWILDPANPAAPAGKGDNFRDNVEQVHVTNPEAGTYIVRIDHKGMLEGGSQDFALIVSGGERTKTWHIYPDGSGDVPDIATAVASASDGDYIFVYPGVYYEHDIVVDKQLVIKGIGGREYIHINARSRGRCFQFVPSSGPVRLEDFTLTNGLADGSGIDGCGGAILCRYTDVAIINCIVRECEADRGGGICLYQSSPLIKSSRIYDNTANDCGSGIYAYSSEALIDKCVIIHNRSRGDGGGVCFEESSVNMVNCTISHNSSHGHGGGVFVGDSSIPNLVSTIIAFSWNGEGIYGSPSAGGVLLSCCDIYGNVDGDYGGTITDQTGSNGNISEDPLFCNFMSLNCGIGDSSPCRAEGNSCGVLIGADGVSCHTRTLLYVKADGTGDAPTIQAAIDAAADGDTVLLAAGTYTGDGNRNLSFLGKAILVTSESGPDATIIDCESSPGNNHSGFDFSLGEDTTSVLDGVTVTGASKGGIRCVYGSSPVIRDCTITGNSAMDSWRGGGIYLEDSSPRILNCTITYNSAEPNGGGIHCNGASPQIVQCVIAHNTAQKYGGGIGLSNSSEATIIGCTISQNTATAESGGGLYTSYSSVSIEDCDISENTAKFGGGVFNAMTSFMTIKRSIISGNETRNGGGGVYSMEGLTMDNCTLVGNSAPYYGTAIECMYGSNNHVSRSIIAFHADTVEAIFTIADTLDISCSDVYGNGGGNYGGNTPDQTGMNDNISEDPLFCDLEGRDYNIYDTSPCAPAHSPCGEVIGALDVRCKIAPDLVVSRVEFSRSDPVARDSITTTVTIKNVGVVDADSFHVDLFANPGSVPVPGQTGDQRHRLYNLAVGDSAVWVSGPMSSETFGQWMSYVMVDSDNWISEIVETDNVSGPHTVRWQIPTERGWPVSGGGGFHSSPALADMDGDPATLEVIVGCDDGKIHVWTAHGEAAPGWPVDCGDTIYSSPAVGDIVGDSRNEVVVGCTDGRIYTFDNEGQTLWDVATGGPVHVTPALADLDADGKLEVICGSVDSLYVLKGSGDRYAGGWPYYLGGTGVSAAAVGDVDNDGYPEITIVSSGYTGPVHSKVYLLVSDGSPFGAGWPVTVDTVIVADPVIGDLDPPHGSLAIVAGALNGKVYAWNSSGELLFSPPRITGSIESSPILVNFDRDNYLEIVVTSRVMVGVGELLSTPGTWEGQLSVVDNNGDLIDSKAVASWIEDVGPLASAVAIGDTAVIIVGAPDTEIHAQAFGFPLDLHGGIISSPAAGDIDDDGWVELLAATNTDSVYCFELSSSHYSPTDLWWPMFRRGPNRTGSYGYEPRTDVEEVKKETVPAVSSLRSIYPNPFNPVTKITFDLSSRASVNLSIYDVTGRRVCVLVDRVMNAGSHEVIWRGLTDNGLPAASGIYFCRLVAGDVVETKKMVLLR